MCTGMAGAVMEQQVAMILNCNVSENDQFDLACYVLEKGPRPENVRIKLFKFILSMPGTLYSINKEGQGELGFVTSIQLILKCEE